MIVTLAYPVNRAQQKISIQQTDELYRMDETGGYIEYNNCAVVESSVYSVFDLLYRGYAHQRRLFLQKHRQVSVYDSENLLYAVIETVLQKPEFSTVSCAVHVSLVNLIKDYSLLDADETTYARNPLTHIMSTEQ